MEFAFATIQVMMDLVKMLNAQKLRISTQELGFAFLRIQRIINQVIHALKMMIIKQFMAATACTALRV